MIFLFENFNFQPHFEHEEEKLESCRIFSFSLQSSLKYRKISVEDYKLMC